MSKSDHFGLVIGIDAYQSELFNTLRGASADAGRFYDWLCAPSGGDVPKANVALLTNPQQGSAPHPDSKRATYSNVLQQIANWKKLSNYMQQPIGSRLYIYLSGHGYNSRNELDKVHLVLEAFDDTTAEAFPGTGFGSWFQIKALFSEVVLIMDCCRDRELSLVPREMPVGSEDAVPGKNPAEVRILFSYGAEYGRKSRERNFNGGYEGVFTKALLEGLTGAAREANSEDVTCTTLIAYLHARVPELAPATGPYAEAQRPSFTTNHTDFILCTVPMAPVPTPRRQPQISIDVPPPYTGISIWDTSSLDPHTGNYSRPIVLNWEVDGTCWSSPIPQGLYTVSWLGGTSSAPRFVVVKGDVHERP
jgi:hypothetical protein